MSRVRLRRLADSQTRSGCKTPPWSEAFFNPGGHPLLAIPCGLNEVSRGLPREALLPKFHLKERSAKGLNLRPHGGPRKGPPCPTGIAFAYTADDRYSRRGRSYASSASEFVTDKERIRKLVSCTAGEGATSSGQFVAFVRRIRSRPNPASVIIPDPSEVADARR